MAKVELLFINIDCGKQQTANNLISEIKTLANCTNDCNCTDGTPSKVIGIGNINNVNVVVQSGGSPISVSSLISAGVTTYTISFDQTLVTKINNAYNTVVVNTDGTITVADSGVVGGVRTYTVSANYTVQNRMEFLVRIQYTGTTAATITNSAYLYGGTNMNSTATTASTSIATAGLRVITLVPSSDPGVNSNFRISAFQVSANSNYKVTMELDIVKFGGVTYTTGLIKPFFVELLNKASGSFDFRFIRPNGTTMTNSDMFRTSTDLYINVKISE